MDFKINDKVTRKSYNNDTLFKITKIEEDIYYLKGINIRLCADAEKHDLQLCTEEKDVENEEDYENRIKKGIQLERNDYFYLPGKILHIDSDQEYLNRCLQYYKDVNIWAIGINEQEQEVSNNIKNLLEEYRPNIVVITGHDAYYKKKGNINDVNAYKNSLFFVNAVKKAREYEQSHEKLIIIAGACGSYYEELIKSGANFASSPKRINIHALDPAVIGVKMSLSDINKDIDLKDILEHTKYGAEGIGGIITKGTMYVGYPR